MEYKDDKEENKMKISVKNDSINEVKKIKNYVKYQEKSKAGGLQNECI